MYRQKNLSSMQLLMLAIYKNLSLKQDTFTSCYILVLGQHTCNNTNYTHATRELRMESTNLIPPTLSSDSSFLNFLGVRGFFLAFFSDSSSGISKAALSRPRPPLMDCHTQRQHSKHAAPQH